MTLKKSYYFAFGCLLFIIFFWPGMMSPDSITQLNQAKTGVLSTHHPIFMTLLWSGLIKLYPGSGLLFALHTLLLWISVVLFSKSFTLKRWWLFGLVPLWPIVFAYTQLIWKDVSFSHAFLLAIALLTWHAYHNKRPQWFSVLIIGILLFYGIGTKFQAVFCVPPLLMWLMKLLQPRLCLFKAFIVSLILSYGLYMAYGKIETIVVPQKQQSHSWQMARLYDLAGMSVDTNQPLFPDYILKNPFFSMEALRAGYSPQNVDALIYTQHPVLIETHAPHELRDLWCLWKKSVKHYPLSYLKHRGRVWLKLMNKKPDNYFVCLSQYSDSLVFKSIIPVADTYMSWFPSVLTRCYGCLIMAFIGLWRFRRLPFALKEKYSFLLYGPTVILTQVFIYYFLSMASDLRYLYLSNILGIFLFFVLFFDTQLSYRRE